MWKRLEKLVERIAHAVGYEVGFAWRNRYLVLVCALTGGTIALAQQPGFQLFNPTVSGHFINGGSGGAAAPVLSGCTAVGPVSDTDGECTASAASGSITFATAFATAPYCIVADASATSTVSMPVYTVSTTAITLSTIISTHNLYWHCASRVGG